MNANRLLSHFERISDAPDAIDRLRRFILDLAVRGKLVEQDERDPKPPSSLQPTDDAESHRTKRPANHRYLTTEEERYSVPASWLWTRLGMIGDWGSGATPSRGKAEYFGGKISWFKSGELNDKQSLAGSEERITQLAMKECSFRHNKPGDVLFAMYGATIGKLAILAEEAVTNQAVVACSPCADVFNRYLFLFLLSQRQRFHMASEGGAQPNVSKAKVVRCPIPLPPLAEQHRIVEKVDALMKLCDRLEASQVERESQRDRLVMASLNRLSQVTDPDEFRKDAGFQLSNLSRLSTKTEHIKEIRKAILNLAVRGKLVPQDERAAPAVGSTEHRASIELPQGWRWGRIADLLDGDSQNGYSKKPDDDPAGIPILRISAATVRSDRIIAEEEYKLIGGVSEKQRDQFTLVPGDLLACRFNGNKSFVGRMAEYRGSHGKAFIYPDKLIRLRLQPSLAIPSLLRHFGESDVVRSEVEGFCATTVGNWGISATNLKSVHIPLPPLAEQKRIVAKVDELMLLCDQLETQLEYQQKGRRQLLEALLHEALEGVG